MRVVGGKTGADGRLFAYIVWTVPGGEAEKGGLRQGDKILEWCGISLVDRSFEEVCSIMDRTGDIAELLVEHASDFRMCDLLEDNMGQQQQQQPPSVAVPIVIPPTQRKNSELVGLVAGKRVTLFRRSLSPLFLFVCVRVSRCECCSFHPSIRPVHTPPVMSLQTTSRDERAAVDDF
jgi:hypothetical protein